MGLSFEYEEKPFVPVRRRAWVRWHRPIQKILLVKKWRDERVTVVAREIATWLSSRGIQIVVQKADLRDYRSMPGVEAVDPYEGAPLQAVDLIVSLGGDGTFLHASRLLRFLDRGLDKVWPPCLVLGMGSLGFLATYKASEWRRAVETALSGHLYPQPCTLRTRLRCSLTVEDTITSWYALNECVVLTRGEAIGKLRLHIDGSFVTLVEGDGLIISSPTGSTGYSLSAGGPIVSPSVAGLVLTPIAPASLSFRPVMISEMSTIEVFLPLHARLKSAEVVLDGRVMGTLKRGGHVSVAVARPIPVLNVASLDQDWFQAITTKLKWNARDVEQADTDASEPELDTEEV